MTKQDAVCSMTENRAMLRVLKFLVKAPASRDEATGNGRLLLTSRVSGTITCEIITLQRLIRFGKTRIKADEVMITASGRQYLLSLKDTLKSDQLEGRERNLDVQTVNLGGHTQSVMVNMAESPLALLYRLNKQTGRRFLSDEEFQAGERLRADFTRGNMLPTITANWEASLGRRLRGERGGVADLSDHALDCRARVEKALRSVGPELSGVLLDICCFLKGLELVERERIWPARSAKMLLKTALSILHRSYMSHNKTGQKSETDATGTRFHWGDTDYRPSL